jgi:hypothetical protein
MVLSKLVAAKPQTSNGVGVGRPQTPITLQIHLTTELQS